MDSSKVFSSLIYLQPPSGIWMISTWMTAFVWRAASFEPLEKIIGYGCPLERWFWIRGKFIPFQNVPLCYTLHLRNSQIFRKPKNVKAWGDSWATFGLLAKGIPLLGIPQWNPGPEVSALKVPKKNHEKDVGEIPQRLGFFCLGNLNAWKFQPLRFVNFHQLETPKTSVFQLPKKKRYFPRFSSWSQNGDDFEQIGFDFSRVMGKTGDHPKLL